MKIVIVTGGFDPLHSGHIAYFQAAKALGHRLVVGLNSDDWLVRKKGRPFMPMTERRAIVENLSMVDRVIEFNDSDDSARDAIRLAKLYYPMPAAKFIFANGGDRTQDNIPEMSEPEVEFVFGVGGENKKNSSSWILEDWKSPKTERPWGYYRVLHTVNSTVKVKELTVNPGATLSMQRHAHRSELWFVAEGEARVNWDAGSEKIKIHKTETIHSMEWHQLHNTSEQPLRVIEIQYGENCTEEDIERI